MITSSPGGSPQQPATPPTSPAAPLGFGPAPTSTTSTAPAAAGGRRGIAVRTAGGSFDFLGGSYTAANKKVTQRSLAFAVAAAIVAVTALFTGFQAFRGTQLNEELVTQQANFAAVQRTYQQQTGEAPLTRAQLEAQLSSSQAALSQANSSAVDVPTVISQIQGVLPPGATIIGLDVKSWSDEAPAAPADTTQAPGSETSSATPAKPAAKNADVTVKVALPASQVPALEQSMSSLPFWKSQTSTTKRNPDGSAETTVTVKTNTSVAPQLLSQLVAGGGN